MSKPENQIEKRQPFMKWYPADWRTEPRLKMVSLAARGLWADLLTVMHEAEPYGFLIIEGKSLTKPGDFVGIVGRPINEIKKAFAELSEFKVFSRVGEDMADDVKALIPEDVKAGTILSRRMLRDRAKADKDRKNGKGGGNPNLKPTGSDAGKPKASTGGLSQWDKAQKPEARSQKPEAREASLAKPREDHDRDRFAILEDACRSAGLPPGRAANESRAASDWGAIDLSNAEILAVITDVANRPSYLAPNTLRYFTPMLIDAAKAKASTPQIDPELLARQRDKAVAGFKASGTWHPDFGPPPTSPDCLASPAVLIEHGFRKPDRAA